MLSPNAHSPVMFSFCVLASGSAGNCTVVRLGPSTADGKPTCLLIDAGLSPRATIRQLKCLDLDLEDISAILLTHLDSDHLHPGWANALAKKRVAVHFRVHHQHRREAWRCGLTAAWVTTYHESFEAAGARVHPMLLAHDAIGSVGFVIQYHGLRLGYATDLGRVPDALLQHFYDLDALAIESNYDRQMQMESERPASLKRRIMGGAGHLSNDQSLEAVCRIASGGTGGRGGAGGPGGARRAGGPAGSLNLSQIVLLHLSRQCNHADRVLELYARQAPHLLPQLTITSQTTPTPWLTVQRLPRRALLPKSTLAPPAAAVAPAAEPALPLFAELFAAQRVADRAALA